MRRLYRLLRQLLPLPLLALAGCHGCGKCPPRPDMRPADLSAPRDLFASADLAEAHDLSSMPDQACIRCDAVLNPCPALGLFCNPGTHCCDSVPHLGATP